MITLTYVAQVLATVGIGYYAYVLGRTKSNREVYSAGHAEGFRLGLNHARLAASEERFEQGEVVAIIDSFDERWAAITLAKGDRPYDVEVDGL